LRAGLPHNVATNGDWGGASYHHHREHDTSKRFPTPHSPRPLHPQTCANTSDQPCALTLAMSHPLYRVL
jgi:hypothetical protein